MSSGHHPFAVNAIKEVLNTIQPKNVSFTHHIERGCLSLRQELEDSYRLSKAYKTLYLADSREFAMCSSVIKKYYQIKSFFLNRTWQIQFRQVP
ncbi:hypothetical protein RMCBS344292_06879 [Rhizopus microsporus]|nr:hypothetical protein RMCBS344292_06879 [Rhizopus microsporus]